MTYTATIIDYGAGNIFSIARALAHIGAKVSIAKSPLEVQRAERLILPGVGAFSDCVKELQTQNLAGAISEAVAKAIPTLGICVGMQALFEESEEFGLHKGLCLIPGRVSEIPSGPERKVPHVGWAPLIAARSWNSTILDSLPDFPCGYFSHSFSVRSFDQTDLLAYVDYEGTQIASVIQRGSIVSCQFHPELSGVTGLAILRNFCRIS
jgi:glutamine amidotransferase